MYRDSAARALDEASRVAIGGVVGEAGFQLTDPDIRFRGPDLRVSNSKELPASCQLSSKAVKIHH